MMSKAETVAAYLEELPDDRRAVLTKVRAVIRKHLPKGYAEQMQYGVIAYVVPHKLYPAGYHCDPTQPVTYAALASQKQYVSIYLMAICQDPMLRQWLRERFAERGCRVDMGKSCLRFKKPEEIPLDLIGEAVAKIPVSDFLLAYEDSRKALQSRPKR